MQKVLKDECGETIVIDGRVGDQTIAAMESIIKRIATIVNKQIPGYSEALDVGAKIDAAMAPVIDLPLVKKLTKPTIHSEWSLTDSTHSISEWSKKLDNLYPLLKQHYPDMDVVLDDHWEMFLSWKDKKTWQVIATIDTSKKEDVIWDNIRVALEGVIAKQNQKPENTVWINSVTKPETKIDGKIQLSPEQTKEVQWKQIQSEIITYATSQWCEVTLIKTDKIAKGIRWVDNTNKDGLALNQFYKMEITKNGKQIGSKEFTLGTDNIVTDKLWSDKINPDLAKLLKGYIDSANLEWAFVEENETINGVEVSSDAMIDNHTPSETVKPQEVNPEAVDKAWYDGFEQASKYAQEKWYFLINKASGRIAKAWNTSRPKINKIEWQDLALVSMTTSKRKDIWDILPATSNIWRMKTAQEIGDEIQKKIDEFLSPEKNEQWSEKISISEQALSEYKKLGITLIKEGNGMRGDFDQNKHFISVETSFDKSGKFIKIEKWPVSKKEWEELLIDHKTKSVTFENGAFTVIDKNGSKMTSVLTEVKNQPMDQEMINNFKNNAPSSVQVLSATDSEIKLKTMTQSNTMRSLWAKSTIETWFDATLWEITFSATKEDPFTKMVWEKQIPKSLIPELRSQGFPIGNSIPTVARIESRLWDNVMVIPHPDGKGFATVCKVGGVHVYNKDNTNPGTVFARKPVIYLYPTEKTKISVSVELSGADMITEYPRTANGTWKVEASPKGNLVDMYDKKKYSYLFWEAAKHTSFTLNPENMDCIASIDIQNYLEKSLKVLGLNAREMNDFMVYWLPILEQNPYSLIEWKTTEYTDMAKLHISPKPETLIRIFMVFKWSEQIVTTKSVELQKTRRKGYSVVEWGGCNLDEKNNIK